MKQQCNYHCFHFLLFCTSRLRRRNHGCRAHSPFVVAVGSRPFGAFGVNLIVSWDLGLGAQASLLRLGFLLISRLDFACEPKATYLEQRGQNSQSSVVKSPLDAPTNTDTCALYVNSMAHQKPKILPVEAVLLRACGLVVLVTDMLGFHDPQNALWCVDSWRWYERKLRVAQQWVKSQDDPKAQWHRCIEPSI